MGPLPRFEDQGSLARSIALRERLEHLLFTSRYIGAEDMKTRSKTMRTVLVASVPIVLLLCLAIWAGYQIGAKRQATADQWELRSSTVTTTNLDETLTCFSGFRTNVGCGLTLTPNGEKLQNGQSVDVAIVPGYTWHPTSGGEAPVFVVSPTAAAGQIRGK